jgi:hypothetical protein
LKYSKVEIIEVEIIEVVMIEEPIENIFGDGACWSAPSA